MSQVCSICNNPKRLELDRLLVEGRSLASIGHQYQVSPDSLRIHRERHLSRQLVQAYEKQELSKSMDLLTRIEDILSKAQNIFDRNYLAKKDDLALRALSEQRNTIELLAKIAAFLHESRAMELQRQQGTYETKWREEQREQTMLVCDRLNPEEQDLLERLHAKINGETDEDVMPYYETHWPKFRPLKVDEPLPIQEEFKQQQMKRTILPNNPLAVKPIPSTPIPYKR